MSGTLADTLWVEDVESLVDVNAGVVVLNADAMDLEESLVVVPRLVDMHQKIVVAVDRYSRLKASDHSLDFDRLGFLMGLKALPVDNATGEGWDKVGEAVVTMSHDAHNSYRHLHVDYGPDVELAISAITVEVGKIPGIRERYSRRDLSIRLIERPEETLKVLIDAPNIVSLAAVVAEQRRALEAIYGCDPAESIHLTRHGFVHGALEATLRHGGDNSDHTLSEKIDRVLTNKWLGFPILALVLYLVFECTFTLGSYPQAWIADGVDWLCMKLGEALPMGWLSSMLVDGVVQGVGAVLAFLPNIIILFFFISLMEDSGYMSRAAFLMDGIMHKVGLHGKSFIPMLVGFGCNVPAIMAAANIENKRDRTLTMLMVPFMSCSARLPVYMLLVGAFFPNQKALVMMSLYLAGVVLSILFALVMKHTPWFAKSDEDYVSELPPFRLPTWRAAKKHIWERCEDYLKKISSVILIASVVIWALYYFPRNESLQQPYLDEIECLEASCSSQMTVGERNEAAARIKSLRMQMDVVQKEHSALAAIGRWMEPVMRPLGFDWKMNVCVLTGLPAKEAIVSTMGILYNNGGEGSLFDSLRDQGVFTPASAYAFMLFVLLYFPCIATVVTLKRHIGRGWAAFTVVHSLVLAWVVAFLVSAIFG